MQALTVTPEGELTFRADGPLGLSAAREKALRLAFGDGLGAGLVHLASAELHGELPLDLGFGREIGRRFLSELCRTGVLSDAPSTLAALVGSAPPIVGGEYLSAATLIHAWRAMGDTATEELAKHDDRVANWVSEKHPSWRSVGRVVFHLAENRGDPAFPFAFLASYVDGVAADGRPLHRPLSQALEVYSDDRDGLLRLLRPLRDAASASAFVADQVDSGAIYHPARWTAGSARAFLSDVPACESAGVVVRIPDWWRAKRRSVQVRGRIGEAPAGGALGVASLLDFRVELTLDGEPLTKAEVDELLEGTKGLRFLRGRWVDADPERLNGLLTHFDQVQEAAERGQFTFAEGMRLLAGIGDESMVADGLDDEDNTAEDWLEFVSGTWLEAQVAKLLAPKSGRAKPGRALRASLRGYQREGVAWLDRLVALGLGGCLADDMGLGKTMQILALLLIVKRRQPGPHMLVVPASLIGNWESEAARFAPSLKVVVAHRSRGTWRAMEADAAGADAVITTYGTLTRTAWLRDRLWGVVVLDEAQAIKNPSARQTRAVKSLQSRARIALTGTPVENRLGDLWSLYDFLMPGLLGSAAEFKAFTRRMATSKNGYAPLRRLIRPYLLRRMKTDPEVAPDLPDKTEVTTFCALSKKQAALYDESVASLARELEEADGMERRGLVLAYLQRFKQICNHPDQWLRADRYKEAESGKWLRLRELCEPIAARQQKVLVFTQFRSLTGPLSRFLASVFERPGLLLHGGTPVRRRSGLVDAFQKPDGPPFFVISLKAGGTGLNLTAATHVVHFDRWWNPAVEAQATDRAYRIGQKRNVLVHKFVCRGTFEERINAMIEEKKALAGKILAGDASKGLTELEGDELLVLLRRDPRGMLVG
ncbi:MAG: DEAD/DEAH box helicase [Myxococcota bacterium]